MIRSQCQNLLSRLRKINLEQFEKYLQLFVEKSSVSDILEFFHAFCGFCVDPCSLLSPSKMIFRNFWLYNSYIFDTDFTCTQISDQKRNIRSPDGTTQGSYSINFGAGINNIKTGRGIESQILMATFRTLVSRLTATPKEIKAPENMVNLESPI